MGKRDKFICIVPFLLKLLLFFQLIEDETGGAYVHALKIGHNIIDDTMDGFLMPVNKQVEWACDLIRNDTNLEVRSYYKIS